MRRELRNSTSVAFSVERRGRKDFVQADGERVDVVK